MTTNPLNTSAEWFNALLVLPRLRIQNANAISSPMTWGFPAITAFLGMMHALERRLGPQLGIRFHGVGVVCHGFEAQVTTRGFTRNFHLTRNPVLSDGSTAGIVEEGRAHLEVTLVFDVTVAEHMREDSARRTLAMDVANAVGGMRLAGGSVMPSLAGDRPQLMRPLLALVPDDEQAKAEQFRRLARRWLPGFALVLRDDLLHSRLTELQQVDPRASALDAWLDLSRWTHRAKGPAEESEASVAAPVEWLTERRVGWTVPIPVGFAALSALHAAGSVAGARDSRTPLRFVESVYSVGQWVSPHRLQTLSDLVWVDEHDADSGLYRCRNHFMPTTAPTSAIAPAGMAHI